MRLVTFRHQGQERLGVQIVRENETFILDLNKAQPTLPVDILLFLSTGASALERAREALTSADEVLMVPESDVTLLAPVPHPGKILCLGHNYAGHIGIGRTELPKYPTIFSKTANTITGPTHPIVIPRITAQVDYEAELAVIIGRRGRSINEDVAMDYVAGYTVFNDVSARDYQKRTSQWMLGKSFDTFGPLGPALVTTDEVPDPHCLELELAVNGVPKQRANTRDLIFSVPFLVAYLSTVMTLEPGDIIATGTPAKLPEASNPQRFLEPGDMVRVTIEKIGMLNNPFVAEVTGQ
jgi:acylpyruvate hydrolase